MRYEAPETLDAAVRLLSSETGFTKILAGGTDLLVQMRTDIVEPEVVVDIKRIGEVRQLAEENGGYRIGAAVTGAELGEHPTLSKVWPGVVEGAELIGSTQIQGRATMGGNLCNGSPAADSVPGLIAAAATATIAGPNGTREMAVEDIMTGPRQLAIGKDELRRRVAVVPQTVELMKGTVRDNLTLFDDRMSDERVDWALAQVGLERHIWPPLWDPVLITVLRAPAWPFFAVLGLLLAWACRDRRKRSFRR